MRNTDLNRPAYITFGVKNNTGSQDPAVVATAVRTSMVAANSFSSKADSTVTHGPIKVALGQTGGEPLLGENTVSFVGGTVHTAPPPNVAVLVKKRTLLGGKKNRGRLFLPWWVGEGNIDEGGIIAAATVTGIQTAMAEWLAQLGLALVPMVILHTTDTSIPPNVSGLTVDPLVSTQRRRLGKRT